MEGIGLAAHRRFLRNQGGEAEASMLEQASTYGKTYITRNILIGVNATTVAILAALGVNGVSGFIAWSMVFVSILAAAIIGRALFYVLVIPTTMPGAFFWKNQGFQEHARQSGLAQMPQVGVLPKAEYHDLQKQRVIDDLKNEWIQLKQLGIKAVLRKSLQVVFSRS